MNQAANFVPVQGRGPAGAHRIALFRPLCGSGQTEITALVAELAGRPEMIVPPLQEQWAPMWSREAREVLKGQTRSELAERNPTGKKIATTVRMKLVFRPSKHLETSGVSIPATGT